MLILIILLFGLGFIAFLLRYNFFRLPKKGIVVLLYHSVDNVKTQTNLDKFTIGLDSFEKQMRLLKKLGYQSIKANQIQYILDNQLYKKNKYIFLTFDDGYKNNLDAAKILKKYGFSAIFFISTAYIGKSLDNAAMLDENDIKELVRLGMEIGSHAHFHVKLFRKSSNYLDLYLILTRGRSRI